MIGKVPPRIERVNREHRLPRLTLPDAKMRLDTQYMPFPVNPAAASPLLTPSNSGGLHLFAADSTSFSAREGAMERVTELRPPPLTPLAKGTRLRIAHGRAGAPAWFGSGGQGVSP